MIRRVLATFLLAVMFFPAFVFATAQQGDILLLNGKQYFIYTNPLRAYLERNEPNQELGGAAKLF